MISGLLLGLSAPGIGLWPLAWVGLIPALSQLRFVQGWRAAFLQGSLLGLVYHSILLVWFLGLHPLTWMGFSPWVSFFITLTAWVGAALSQGVIIGIIWMGFYALRRFLPIGFPWVAAALWVVGLYGLNQNPVGLPWGFLAYSQASVPWIRQSTYTLSFYGLEACIIFAQMAWMKAITENNRNWAFLGMVILLITVFVGAAHTPKPSGILRELNPLGIQGNLSIQAERSGLTFSEKEQYYAHLIQKALTRTHEKVRLVILPEGALALTPRSSWQQFPLGDSTALLSGGIYLQSDGYHNGALLFQPGASPQVIGKRYLVPFGETTPFVSGQWLAKKLSKWGIDYGDSFTPSSFEQPPFQLGAHRMGALICFEALYPLLASQYRQQGVQLLVTLSNLGWYQQNSLLESQFLAINQMRAAETGIPLILATNTGVSAMISEHGQVLNQTPSGQAVFYTVHSVKGF